MGLSRSLRSRSETPEAAALDTANGDAGCSERWLDKLTVLDGATDKVVGNETVGTQPEGIAYDSSNGYLYVDLYGDSGLGHLSDVTVVNGLQTAWLARCPSECTLWELLMTPRRGHPRCQCLVEQCYRDGASDTVVG